MARFFSSDAVLCAAAISVVLGLLSEQPAHAGGKPDALIRAWAQANEACRGNIKVEPQYDANCLRRGRIGDKIEATGWVYGWPDVIGACQVWHPRGARPSNPDCYFH